MHLSRVASLKSEHKDYNNSLSNIEKIPIHQITQTTPASPEIIQELCEATDKGPSLRLLAKIVHEGWPKIIKDCPHSTQSYWYFRDQITCEDRIHIQRNQTNNAQIRMSINSERSYTWDTMQLTR